VSQDALPESVRRFLASYIKSVEQLEILMVLSEAPDRWWLAEDVFQRIQSSRGSVAERLAHLKSQGFLAARQGDDGQVLHRFRPVTLELGAAAAEAMTAYRTRRVKVIEAIFTPAVDQLQSFANAFKFNKEK
jgi:hypothetical protein